MGHDPLDVIAECLGEPADSMRSPANADFQCPFTNSKCIKFNRTLGEPVPVCSVFRRGRGGVDRPPICVCPVRFYETDIAEDVIRECWGTPKPKNAQVVHEIQMEKFGKVDLVIADLARDERTITKFLPVELQAVDITGSYLPYYEALIQSKKAAERKSYGFNWANVRKRFISQLIAKGFYCHHWGTRIAAVVQEDLFETFLAHAQLTETNIKASNIVFLLYQYVRAGESGSWSLRFRRVLPTTHLSVMQSILYEQPPSRATFESKVLERLTQWSPVTRRRR